MGTMPNRSARNFSQVGQGVLLATVGTALLFGKYAMHHCCNCLRRKMAWSDCLQSSFFEDSFARRWKRANEQCNSVCKKLHGMENLHPGHRKKIG